ncbi:MAG TPA: MFS transporter [Candidatus Eisenbacteria bacterium]|nr:MFS transporter [Candidatus Eisenbacteria bacterium]
MSETTSPSVEAPGSRVSDEISAEELAHPESLASVHQRPSEPGDGLWSPARRSLTIGLVVTITLLAAEALGVATAMPIVARELGGLELYGLVFSAFFIGTLLGIVVVGGLIDERGLLVPFGIGLGFFALGLVVAGLAPSMPVLIGARFVQGIGAGAIPPVAFVAIGRSLPEHLRPRMFATLSTAWILPGIAGPAVAGVVAEALNWRLVFLGLLPILVVSGAIAFRALARLPRVTRHDPGATARRVTNALLVGLGVAVLTAGLASDLLPVILGVAAMGLAVTGFAFRRLTPLGTLRARRGYPTAVLLRGLLTFAFFCVDAYVALLLVEVRGWLAAGAGLALTAATVSWTAGSWIQARLSTRFPPDRFVRIGFPVVALGFAGLGAVLVPEVPAWLGIPAFAVAGLGMGLTYAQFALIVLRDVPPPSQGTVTAGLTLSDALGTALGKSVAAALISTTVRAGIGPGPGIGAAIVVGVAAALVGFVLAPRLRRRAEVAGAVP